MKSKERKLPVIKPAEKKSRGLQDHANMHMYMLIINSLTMFLFKSVKALPSTSIVQRLIP